MHAKYSHINVSPSVISLLYFLCVEFRKEFFLLRALTIGYLHLLKVLHSTLGVVQHPITNTLGVLIWSMCVSTRKGASIHPFFNSVGRLSNCATKTFGIIIAEALPLFQAFSPFVESKNYVLSLISLFLCQLHAWYNNTTTIVRLHLVYG